MTHTFPGTPSPAVLRAAAILTVLADGGDTSLRVTDVARETGIPNSSATNILAALVESGLARRVGTGYSIGPATVELASFFLRSEDPVQRFRDFVPQMPFLASETAQLGTLQGGEVLFLARHDGKQPIALTSSVGKRLPASSTAIGKAMLARLTPEELTAVLPDPLVRLTSRSHADIGSLVHDLDNIRLRGHAADDEEAAPNVVCLAVAVESPEGGPRYAISTTLFKERLTPKLRSELVADLETISSYLSK